MRSLDFLCGVVWRSQLLVSKRNPKKAAIYHVETNPESYPIYSAPCRIPQATLNNRTRLPLLPFLTSPKSNTLKRRTTQNRRLADAHVRLVFSMPRASMLSFAPCKRSPCHPPSQNHMGPGVLASSRGSRKLFRGFFFNKPDAPLPFASLFVQRVGTFLLWFLQGPR